MPAGPALDITNRAGVPSLVLYEAFFKRCRQVGHQKCRLLHWFPPSTLLHAKSPDPWSASHEVLKSGVLFKRALWILEDKILFPEPMPTRPRGPRFEAENLLAHQAVQAPRCRSRPKVGGLHGAGMEPDRVG